MAKQNAGAEPALSWFSEFNSFYSLTSDATLREVAQGIRGVRITSQMLAAQMLGAGQIPVQPRADQLEALWREVKAHPIYQRLRRDGNFKEALNLFHAKQRRRKPGLYGDDFAGLRFLNLVAAIRLHEGYGIGRSFRDFPTREDAKKAQAYIDKLLAMRDKGIRLLDWKADSECHALLIALRRRIESVFLASERKPRSDASSAERNYMIHVASLLDTGFGEASPAILAALGAMIGFTPDISRVRGYIKEMKHRRAREVRASHPEAETGA
jgi:hypothetical protein